MKLIFKLFLILFFSSTVKAQHNLDSAKELLDKGQSFSNRYETLRFLRKNTKQPLLRIQYSKQLLGILEGKDSLEQEIFSLNDIGFYYKQLGNVIQASEYFYQSATLANQHNLLLEESHALGNLASTYNIVGDYQKAGKLLKQSLAIAYQLKDTSTIHPALINLGNNFYYREIYDSALIYLQRSIQVDRNNQFSELFNSYSTGTAALALAKLGRLDTAEYLLDKSIEVWSSYEDYSPIAECLVDIAGTYKDEGLYDKSLQFALEGYALADEKGFQQFKRDGARLLVDLYRDANRLDSAMYYQTIYYQTKDSIQNVETVKKVETERANFEISKKQSEVDLLETQKNAREQFLLGITIILLLVVIGAVIVFRSLQLQRRLGRELSDQKLQLEQLNSAKDKLFSIISHDLRGPIVAFRGVGNMINLGVKRDDKNMLTEVAEEVRKSSTNLNEMLENLLSWAMQEQDMMVPKPEVLDVQALFDELEGIYTQQANVKNISLAFTVTGGVQLYADRNAASTIFRNLLGNALKFTPEHGSIRVNARSTEDQVEINVTDTGLGMSEEKVASLFTFQSSKPSFGTSGEKGLGLGLNLVLKMIQANQGTLHVDSILHQGSTFTVLLPKGT